MPKRDARRRRKLNTKQNKRHREQAQSGDFTKLSTELYEDPHKTLIELRSTFRRIVRSTPTPIGEGSRMAGDQDVAPDLISLPNLCQHYISGSNDFLSTLHRILPSRSGRVEIPRYSAYPLIRGMIEHSAQAVWLLGPADRRERFVRLLQVQKSEMDYDRRYIDSTSSTAHLRADDTPEMRSQAAKVQREAKAVRNRRTEKLAAIGEVLGIGKDEFEHGVQGGYEAIVYHAFSESHLMDSANDENESHWMGRYAASVWMFVSGLAHPSVSRAWANAESGRPDGSLDAVETASNPIIVRDSLLVALRLQAYAFVLWKSACTTP
jgi:hypothetical protein